MQRPRKESQLTQFYSEISIGFHSTSELDNALSNIGVLNEQISKDVAFAAGKAFVKYRRNGGKKSSLLLTFLSVHMRIAHPTNFFHETGIGF